MSPPWPPPYKPWPPRQPWLNHRYPSFTMAANNTITTGIFFDFVVGVLKRWIVLSVTHFVLSAIEINLKFTRQETIAPAPIRMKWVRCCTNDRQTHKENNVKYFWNVHDCLFISIMSEIDKSLRMTSRSPTHCVFGGDASFSSLIVKKWETNPRSWSVVTDDETQIWYGIYDEKREQWSITITRTHIPIS